MNRAPGIAAVLLCSFLVACACKRETPVVPERTGIQALLERQGGEEAFPVEVSGWMDNRFEDWRLVTTEGGLREFRPEESLAIDASVPALLEERLKKLRREDLSAWLRGVKNRRSELGLSYPPDHSDPRNIDKKSVVVVGVYYRDGDSPVKSRICPVSIEASR